jgi:hypothetical protein
MTEHDCPHCRCLPYGVGELGYVNRDAPYYPLVELCDQATKDRTHE